MLCRAVVENEVDCIIVILRLNESPKNRHIGKIRNEHALIDLVFIIIDNVVGNLLKQLECADAVERLHECRHSSVRACSISEQAGEIVIHRICLELDLAGQNIGGDLRTTEGRGHKDAAVDLAVSVLCKISDGHYAAHARAEYRDLVVSRLSYCSVNCRGDIVGDFVRVETPVVCKQICVVGGKILGTGAGHSALAVRIEVFPNLRIILRAPGIFRNADIVLRLAVFFHRIAVKQVCRIIDNSLEERIDILGFDCTGDALVKHGEQIAQIKLEGVALILGALVDIKPHHIHSPDYDHGAVGAGRGIVRFLCLRCCVCGFRALIRKCRRYKAQQKRKGEKNTQKFFHCFHPSFLLYFPEVPENRPRD